MATIKGGKIIEDTWQHVPDDSEVPADGDVIVGFERFRAEGPALAKRAGRLGVRLPNDRPADEVASDLVGLELVAIDFPKFADGRGYSIARKLREQYRFEGELRAIGYVLRDQLFYMQRCGFDAFELREGKDAEGALEAFKEYSVVYQAAADEPRPLYRRR